MSDLENSSGRREAALQLLNSRVDFERLQAANYSTQDFKLDRMRELLRRLGHPEEGLPVVHVAGTKGKGSTAAMIAASLTVAGYRVGLFTSPHVDRIEERLAIDGRICPSAELVELIERIRPDVEAMDRQGEGGPFPSAPTFFEIITALAWLWFRAHKVDLAVLEVGLGGRLDSTNVCQPAVSVITSISYDHVKLLGNTLTLIAGEKAGIIKPDVPVVSGVTDEEPRQVIVETCRRHGCRLAELNADFTFSYRPPRHLEREPAWGELDYQALPPAASAELSPLRLGLPGRHQAANAAVAVAVLLELRHQGWQIPEAAVRAGLANLIWPARVEVVARHPTIVIDAAHNTASVEALRQCLDESFAVNRRFLLFATSRDKDVRGMLEHLSGGFDEVIFTQFGNNPRAEPAEELRRLAQEITGRPARAIPDAAAAWGELCRQAAPDDLLCVTGSFYLASEIRRLVAGVQSA